MGNNCCGGREDEKVKQRAAADSYASGIRSKYASGMRNTYRSGNARGGDDCERFDKAFENNDLKEFIRLLGSTQKIDSLEEPMHPWAEDPKTVGALAATQLAILASTDGTEAGQSETRKYKDEIRKLGGIDPLVQYLKSPDVDRNEAAVVALSFLSVDSDTNCQLMYDAGAIELLVPHLKSQKEGMRAATASTLRNLYVISQEARKEFASSKGLVDFLKLLDFAPPKKGAEPNWDTQFEALFNLEDLMTMDDEVVPEIASLIKGAGVIPKLEKLSGDACPDEEVKELAQAIMGRLEGAS
uniref:Nucleotide exchange factor Fes1 domain-containing protein n=1 Tax=Chromera velia CCMP2878 TaxID=1169474 RepID=A0A0G4I3K8_9ALVE|eukprot:Cvel_10697.t1-p1 / transcript=Cvel_10697.t1 / gene=Cvel_10697 / organism=Chromera_velia_CCMP2878 / gene_product=ARMADILLO BTB ARABIDOPSIS PROTEIN 1, putative / transcript_product=ARMADILLO BTB ARABIDOPSIS PROTEIN 1, putative / location=Cvel_scaffold650:61729-63389(+) / protein_length=298 / sequence_SO=supercontig / SO=protein_coding / is_pseudo=false